MESRDYSRRISFGGRFRASCSIPIYFQPVNRRHIDGGLLSNLPAFVFSNRSVTRRSLTSKILAFSLISEHDAPSSWNTKGFLLNLVNALVDGGTRLQLQLQPNVHVVNIPTGDVRATDFDRMTPEITQKLVDGGLIATRKFFDEEHIYVRTFAQRELICFDKDKFYCRITQTLTMNVERLIVAEHNSAWVYKLLPTDTLSSWARRPGRCDSTGKRRSPWRWTVPPKITWCSGRECLARERGELCATSSDCDPSSGQNTNEGTRWCRKEGKADADAVLYQGYLDAGVVGATLEKLESLIEPLSPTEKLPSLSKILDSEIIQRLRAVGQYANESVQLSIESAEIGRTWSRRLVFDS